MTAHAIFSVPIPNHSSISQRCSVFTSGSGSWRNVSEASLVRHRSTRLISLSSSSPSPATSVPEDGTSLPAGEIAVQAEAAVEGDEESTFRGCKACGRDELERGCDGGGRIQGGIATVPGFGWWPIKAYRPCPRFLASGGRYRRQGQSMDEVAFGRGEQAASAGTSTKVESSKSKRSARIFKS